MHNPSADPNAYPPQGYVSSAPQAIVAAPQPVADPEILLDQFQMNYEINPKHTPFLRKLPLYQFIFVLDDSGSMNSAADPDGDVSVTRWDELKQFMKIILDAHQIFNLTCDCYFINRGLVRSISSYSQLEPYLVVPPSGYTNTVAILDLIKQHHIGADMGKPLMLNILTDGHATTANGVERFLVSITLCTDDESIERVYRPIERAVNVDVSLDYRGEMLEVRQRRGRDYRFTYGDYVVKITVGTIDKDIHNVDALPATCCRIV